MILRSTKGSALTYDEMDNNLTYLDTTKVDKTSNETIAGIKTFSSPINGNIIGNATTATRLLTPRKINGILFDGTADIIIPAQSITGDTITDFAQTFKGLKTFSDGLVADIDGNAKTADKLKVGRKINGVLFDGTADINLPIADQTNFCTLSTDQTISGNKTFSVSPSAPTPSNNDNSTKLATTAFVRSLIATVPGVPGPVGAQGPQGPAGAQGPVGPAGSDKLKITYGTVICDQGLVPLDTNTAGYIPTSTAENYADVYPPTGFTMSNLVGFIPSMNLVSQSMTSDLNVAYYCRYYVMTDSVRIQCASTGLKQAATANYLAIWMK